MNKITIGLFISILFFMSLAQATDYNHDELWKAICQVETGGTWKDSDKPGAAGEIGIAQIRKVCVDDVNRILKLKKVKERYTYNDRLSVVKSREMFYIYIGHYAKYYYKTQGKQATYEVKARIWNGGPSGWKKSATVHYWDRVKIILHKK